jgi:Tfp pilus assembly protein PilZ
MMVKATDRDKELLHTMAEIFPSVKTNWNSEAGFRALYNDSDKSGEENLLAFVRDCRNFKPRALRQQKRHEKKVNVLYWPTDASEETAQRAYTLDISSGGLFVCTCDPPPEDSLVWVILREVDARPFKVMVKWKLAWGVAMRVPGFGGSFVDVDSGLAEKLETLLTEKKRGIR